MKQLTLPELTEIYKSLDLLAKSKTLQKTEQQKLCDVMMAVGIGIRILEQLDKTK